MEIRCPDNKNYILKINKLADSEVFTLPIRVDNKIHNVVLSNKGDYSIYLGHFSSLCYEEDNRYSISLEEEIELNSFYEGFKFTPNSLEVREVIRNKGYIFDDLKEFSGPNLVKALKRLAAIAYYANGDLAKIEDVKYGLEFIISNWYQGKENYTGNWWDYEIGASKSLCEALILIHGYIDKEDIFRYLNASRFYLAAPEYLFYRRNYPSIKRERATGANLLDNIYICTLRGILQENKDEMDNYFSLIAEALKEVKEHDGFYSDGGFIQHGSVPYNCSYGEVVLNSTTKLLNIFYLLGYDCSKYLNRLINLIKEAYLPFLYDGVALECVRGRSCSRVNGDSHYSYNIMLAAIKRLNEIFKRPDLGLLIKQAEAKEYNDEALVFNSINRYIRRNSDYLLAISANSSYISTYESFLGENLEGAYQSNFTYDILYNNENKLDYPREAYFNKLYRPGSTNTNRPEPSDSIIENKMTAGVELDGIMLIAFDQNSDVKGKHIKLMLPNSMLSIGFDIKSQYDYHTTYLDTKEHLSCDGRVYEAKHLRLITKDEVNVYEYNEKRSLRDINKNNPELDYINSGFRLYSENKSEYQYQLYPFYKGINDKYKVAIENGAIYISYNNYLCIASFTENEKEYKGIHLAGIFAAIIRFDGNSAVARISAGSRMKRELYLELDKYNSLAGSKIYTNDSMIIIRNYEEAVALKK